MKNATGIQLELAKWMVAFLIMGSAALGWAYEVKNSVENGVRVQVTPQILSPNKPARFLIRLSTHSVELDQDLTVIAELRDERNRIYKALKWEGSPPGGHHRSGTLTFSELQATAGRVTLIIRDVGSVAQRDFSWEIE